MAYLKISYTHIFAAAAADDDDNDDDDYDEIK